VHGGVTRAQTLSISSSKSSSVTGEFTISVHEIHSKAPITSEFSNLESLLVKQAEQQAARQAMDDSLTSDEDNARSHFVSRMSAGEAIGTVISLIKIYCILLFSPHPMPKNRRVSRSKHPAAPAAVRRSGSARLASAPPC
jgi:hypothetical protein